LLIRVITMRRLGRSVNADVVIINSIMIGDGVIMCKSNCGDGGGC
jgi:hypothetical protein